VKDLISLGEDVIAWAQAGGADETEAYLESGRRIAVTVENNAVKLAKSDVHDGIGVRVFIGGRLGFGSINRLDPAQVRQIVDNGVALARVSIPDPAQGIPEPMVSIPGANGLFDERAERFGMEDALKLAQRMLDAAVGYDSRVSVDSGLFSAEIVRRAVINSKGVRREESRSLFIYSLVGMAIDGDDISCGAYEYDAARLTDDINVSSVGRELGKKVIDSLGARTGETFTGTVLLSPGGVEELLEHTIIGASSALRVQKGMSQFAGKLGQKVASSCLTIEDDGLLEGGVGSASFDREGVPHQQMVIVDQGILKSYLHNSYTARKDGLISTGHASGGTRSLPGVGSTNVLIASGEKTKDELVAGIQRGVIVTRFSGFPNSITGDFSGVVKGGFLVERGEIVRPIVGTMIAGNVYQLLHQISGTSKERRKMGTLISPWIAIEDVSVTAG
jgi:PmbA protein